MSSIPMDQWGKDHWSTLAYIETRCVDHGGELRLEHMRCNTDRHPEMIGNMGFEMRRDWNPEHGTRLQRERLPGTDLSVPNTLPWHDDWDCVEDMVAAGLVEATPIRTTFRMTSLGNHCAATLRRFKAAGGNYGDFHSGLIEPLQPSNVGQLLVKHAINRALARQKRVAG